MNEFSRLFKICFQNTIGNEGGYYDNPKDKGGPTNFGIAFNFNQKQLEVFGIIKPEQMIGLTLDQARKIYHDKYWVPAKCNEFRPFQLETLKTYFDMVIHAGKGGGGKCLQQSINQFRVGKDYDVVVDGKVGIKTLEAFNSLIDGDYDPDDETNDFNFSKVYNAMRSSYYLELFNDSRNVSWFGNLRFLNSGLRRL
jgi:typhoid toxin secretion A